MYNHIVNYHSYQKIIKDKNYIIIDDFLPSNAFAQTNNLIRRLNVSNNCNWPLKIFDGMKKRTFVNLEMKDTQVLLSAFNNNISQLPKLKTTFIYWYYAYQLSSKYGKKINRLLKNLKKLIFTPSTLSMMSEISSEKLICNYDNFFLTKYDAQSFITSHTDYSTNSALQYKLTFLLYLNQQWNTNDGGQLMLNTRNGLQCIAPVGNRLVLFVPNSQSDHWVSRPQGGQCRYAVSGWFT